MAPLYSLMEGMEHHSRCLTHTVVSLLVRGLVGTDWRRKRKGRGSGPCLSPWEQWRAWSAHVLAAAVCRWQRFGTMYVGEHASVLVMMGRPVLPGTEESGVLREDRVSSSLEGSHVCFSDLASWLHPAALMRVRSSDFIVWSLLREHTSAVVDRQ